MDLKSGDLFWPRLSHSRACHLLLREDVRCDVAVIGAGLSGAMVAHTLSREGLDVVVLDKRGIGQGSTSASTALVLYEIDMPLIDLARQRGHAAAVQSYRRCLDAIGELEELVRQLGGGCGFRRRRSLYMASQPADLRKLEKEFEARKRAGFDVDFLPQTQIEKWFSFSAPGAIYSTDAAEVDPLRLTTLLMKGSIRRGARVFTRTEAANVTETRNGAITRSSTGHQIEARWVVAAAGFETAARAARRVVKLKSSYALVTRPVSAFPGWHQRCLIWETKRPYLYLRTTADNRIVIGGEDEDFVDARKRDRLIKKKSAVLTQKLSRMFPDIPVQPAGCWAGTFGETKDGLPYVGPLEPRSKVLYALCYGANGTNFAVIAADIIRDSILKRRNPHARLFGFDR
jgi:glycine/D-amino acid oxidase-like deaminating enzyme